MNIEQREFIKGYHINPIYKRGELINVVVGIKEFYWEVPEYLKGNLKKGDLVITNVKNKYTSKGEELVEPIRKSIVIVDDILNEFKPIEGTKLRFVSREFKSKRAKLIKNYICIGMINKDIYEESLAMDLGKRCNLSERSINGLLKKYDTDKVKKAVDMYLATNNKKAPLKFLKFILEKIS